MNLEDQGIATESSDEFIEIVSSFINSPRGTNFRQHYTTVLVTGWSQKETRAFAWALALDIRGKIDYKPSKIELIGAKTIPTIIIHRPTKHPKLDPRVSIYPLGLPKRRSVESQFLPDSQAILLFQKEEITDPGAKWDIGVIKSKMDVSRIANFDQWLHLEKE